MAGPCPRTHHIFWHLSKQNNPDLSKPGKAEFYGVCRCCGLRGLTSVAVVNSGERNSRPELALAGRPKPVKQDLPL